jgi:hypothetical protein
LHVSGAIWTLIAGRFRLTQSAKCQLEAHDVA